MAMPRFAGSLVRLSAPYQYFQHRLDLGHACFDHVQALRQLAVILVVSFSMSASAVHHATLAFAVLSAAVHHATLAFAGLSSARHDLWRSGTFS